MTERLADNAGSPISRVNPVASDGTRFERNLRTLYTAVAIIIFIVVLGVVAMLDYLYRIAETRAAVSTQNIVKTIELNIDSLIDRLNIAIQASADEIARQLAAGKLNTESVVLHLARLQDRIPEAAYIRVMDQHGNLISGQRLPWIFPEGKLNDEAVTRYLSRLQDRHPEATNIRAVDEHGDIISGQKLPWRSLNRYDQDMFTRLRDDSHLELLSGKPIYDQISELWVWPFACRINMPHGRFGGVILGTLPLLAVESLFKQVQLGPNSAIILRDRELELVAQYPVVYDGQPVATGGKPGLSPAFLAALESDPLEGTLVSELTSLDKINRTYSYRRSNSYGYLAVVGISREAALIEWRKQAWIIAGLSLAFIVSMLLSIQLIGRAWRNQERDLASLQESQLALAKAKEEAETASRAKSAFLANISHELRTPLNAILGFAQLLEKDRGMTQRNRHMLVTINRSGNHLLALINDVLEISRIEAGHSETRETVFDLIEMLQYLADMILLRAERKGLAFMVSHAPELPRYVRGDDHRLRQILINLLSNAVKYTERGGISLTAGLVDGLVRFEVADTGPGICEEDQEKIFEAFYQTENGIAKGEGAGLGLSICREHARLLGGQLGLDSRLGQGSRFVLTIPLPATEIAPARSSTQPGRVEGLESGLLPPRILMVDDNDDNRELVRHLLEDVGFEVCAVESGQQAIDTFASWNPQLVVMDMMMPLLDGYEASRRIRAMPGGREVKIVALTAIAFEENRAAVLDAGCDELVKKPLEVEQLFEVMGRLLGIRYRYSEEKALSLSEATSDLSGYPEELREKLRTAAEQLDLEKARDILMRWSQERGKEVPVEIANLLTQYRFDRIIELCNQGGKRM